MHGILLVDKPEGITSHDVVKIVKKYVRPSKVGHSGTLDSAASGLMVLLIGAATRSLDYLDESRKTYLMTVVLGEETDTCDREGEILRTTDAGSVTLAQIMDVLPRFMGVQEQVPPHYSAIKREGVPLYKLARKGIFPELTPRMVEIFSLDVKAWNPPLLELSMVCSKGTYARALARDLGHALEVGGRLETLRRTSSGPFKVEMALSVDEIKTRGTEAVVENLISLAEALSHIPDLHVLPNETRKLMRGSGVAVLRSRLPSSGLTDELPARMFKIVGSSGDFVIIVKPEARRGEIYLQPVKLFNSRSE